MLEKKTNSQEYKNQVSLNRHPFPVCSWLYCTHSNCHAGKGTERSSLLHGDILSTVKNMSGAEEAHTCDPSTQDARMSEDDWFQASLGYPIRLIVLKQDEDQNQPKNKTKTQHSVK